jgi:hypothetical protein
MEMERLPTDSQVESISDEKNNYEGGDDGMTRKINESIRYNATPSKPTAWNLFETQKFEPFKYCCGNCFHLDATQAIIASYNPMCGCITKMVWKCMCPERLKRMEHYCQNCGTLLAVAYIPKTDKMALWKRHIPDVEKFKAVLAED